MGTASLDSVDQTVSDVMEYMLDRVCHQSKELYRVDSADEHTPHTANSVSPQNGSTPLAVDSTSEVCVTSGFVFLMVFCYIVTFSLGHSCLARKFMVECHYCGCITCAIRHQYHLQLVLVDLCYRLDTV